jgi:hypothetical protein
MDVGKYTGRKRQLEDIEPPRAKESVENWLSGLKDGHGSVTAVYALGRYLRWRASQGLQMDPDAMTAECLDGTTRVHIQHFKALEYCQNLADSLPATKQRN